MLHAVVTTIQPPTACVRRLTQKLLAIGGRLIVAGDSKGPDSFELTNVSGLRPEHVVFLSLGAQLQSPFKLAQLVPTKHYARKNIAYLHAIRDGATCIYETDDDNGPLDSWQPREQYLPPLAEVRAVGDESPAWVNVYRHFSEQNIWPRGLPLNRIHNPIDVFSNSTSPSAATDMTWAPIQQGLADGAPDVDAIWRLVMDREFCFEQKESIRVPSGQWCPFNTQSTWWWPAVYPLLYIPSFCSFRMCDIWKSFVAQRCLWELGTGVVFHAPEVWQDRNYHNLLRDFDAEIPGYQQNDLIAKVLQDLPLRSGAEHICANLRFCYESLVYNKIFPAKELELVDAWLADYEAVS